MRHASYNRLQTGILVSDQGEATLSGSSKVLLVRDRDGDGRAASDGEVSVFFDGTNASGLPTPTENVFSIFQAHDRSVFISDGDSDSVYRLYDRNSDGDANDAREAGLWFSAANAAGYSLVTPNSVAQGKDGAVYITNAGTASAPPDMIYRTVDRNHDGDANDAGEATIWADLQQVMPTSVPFDITFVGNVAYVSDLTGAAPDVIHRLEDKNRDGHVDASEITTFAFEPDAFGAPIDIAIDSQNGDILSLTWTASAGDPHRLYRLSDVNGDGTIDSANEAVEVWNSTHLPEGFSQLAGFSVSASSNGQVALAVNGGDPTTKNIYLLTDYDGDGLYTGAYETSVLASNSYTDDALYRPRAVEFYNDDLDFSMTRGSARNDVMGGWFGDDVLLGLKGNDTLLGLAGSDELWGGLGNDTLVGGFGADVLAGGTGTDKFVYLTLWDSSASASGRDRILDLDSAENDRIDLRLIDANACRWGNQSFSFIGNGEFSKTAGELRYAANGDDLTVYADVNGDGKADFALDIVGRDTLAAQDFLL